MSESDVIIVLPESYGTDAWLAQARIEVTPNRTAIAEGGLRAHSASTVHAKISLNIDECKTL
jgi:hypothetical protein